MTPEEIKEMSEGGRPYTLQQNEVAEAKRVQPKPPISQPSNNGEKLYKKCPTCGGFVEAGMNPTIAQSQPFIPKQTQVKNGRIVNQLIRPMPQDAPQPRPDKIESDEKLSDGRPTVEAQWGESTSKVPNTPIR